MTDDLAVRLALELAKVTAERDQLRTVERVEARMDEWDDWPITAQGQAADMLRDLRAALDGV